MKKILVATGSSENKKKFAIEFIQNYCNEKGIDVTVAGENIYDLNPNAIEADVIVAIGPVNFETKTPIIQGTAFLTKFGMEAACENIIKAIR